MTSRMEFERERARRSGRAGGGDAGGATGDKGVPRIPPPAAPPLPSPGGGNTQLLTRVAGPSARDRAVNNAAQQGGLGPINWSAGNAEFDAAVAAGKAAATARAAQGGRGVLSGDALPDTSNPATQAYWDRADIKAWANANPKLAEALMAKHGFTPGVAAAGLPQMSAQAGAGTQFAMPGEAPVSPDFAAMPNKLVDPFGGASAAAGNFSPAGELSGDVTGMDWASMDPQARMRLTSLAREAAAPPAVAPAGGQFSAEPQFQTVPAAIPAAPVGNAQVAAFSEQDPAQVFNRRTLDAIKNIWRPQQ